MTLEVAAGEAVLLVGRNGAGKTTLLRIATGFLDPDAGTVTIDGIAIADRARAQARLGYLPEHAPAPAELTVREHLRTRARLKGCGDDAVDRAMRGGGGRGARPTGGSATLSKGFRQRVGLADALLGEPPLLVLDEPTSGMDPIQTRELRDHLDRRGEGARGARVEPRGRATSRRSRRASRCCATASWSPCDTPTRAVQAAGAASSRTP